MFRCRIFLVLILVFLPAIAVVRGQMNDLNQKASLLFNLARFVEWPEDSYKTPDDPIVCCLLGDSPLERKLEQIKNPQFIEKRRFQFQHVVDAEELSSCRILFVSAAEQKRWKILGGGIKGQSILTVGETESFLAEGGMIRVDLSSGKIRLQINRDAASGERLHISSRLLSLARIVDTKQ